MTPLERAARALCELISIDPDRLVYGIVEGEKRPIWMAQEFTKQSRAVLLAIREPSDLAVTEGMTASLNSGQGVEPETATAIYQAMIDKALEEG